MSQPYPIRLALFFGGVSSEHEVSCVSAAAWLRALALPPCANKYEVTAVGITKDGRWLRYGGPAARVEDGSWQTDTEALTPCVLSPDRADRGLLIRQGDGYAVQPVDVCVPVLHGKNGEDGTIQGLFTLAGLPFVGAGVLASVVVPSYRRPALLERCLRALLAQDIDPRRYEIIVCDDGPDDDRARRDPGGIVDPRRALGIQGDDGSGAFDAAHG